MYQMMLDKSGAPVVLFAAGKYISVLPLTKYQYERYIWTTAPDWCIYDEVVAATGRVTPDQLTRATLAQAFVTNLCFAELVTLTQWLGGRPPTEREWDMAAHDLFCQPDFLPEAARFLASADQAEYHDRLVDQRIRHLLETLIAQGIARETVNDAVGELVSKFAADDYGTLYLKRYGATGVVAGTPAIATRSPEFGGSYVLERN